MHTFLNASFVFSISIKVTSFLLSRQKSRKTECSWTSQSLTSCEMAGRLVTWAVRVPAMTCRWQSSASSQNCRAARHTEVNRSQHRERLLLETSSHWTGLRVRETQTGLASTGSGLCRRRARDVRMSPLCAPTCCWYGEWACRWCLWGRRPRLHPGRPSPLWAAGWQTGDTWGGCDGVRSCWSSLLLFHTLPTESSG